MKKYLGCAAAFERGEVRPRQGVGVVAFSGFYVFKLQLK
jgi:hypothetical protein